MHFTLPIISYAYDALEPFFDEETMKIHHQKHHQTYINNTNAALSDLPEFSNLSIIELIRKLDYLPENKKNILRNNAGGHINHSFFWKCLKKNTVLQEPLKTIIEHNFSSIHHFKDKFENVAINHFGSGWVWLIKNNKDKLFIVSTNNQNNPLMGTKFSEVINGTPILGLDIWEHAYYLKYQNKKIDYIQSFWNVVNWDEVTKNFLSNNV